MIFPQINERQYPREINIYVAYTILRRFYCWNDDNCNRVCKFVSRIKFLIEVKLTLAVKQKPLE